MLTPQEQLYNQTAQKIQDKLQEHYPLLHWRVAQAEEARILDPTLENYHITVTLSINNETLNARWPLSTSLFQRLELEDVIRRFSYQFTADLLEAILDWKPAGPIEFKDFIKTLSDPELVTLQHQLRQHPDDKEHLHLVLSELGVRQKAKTR